MDGLLQTITLKNRPGVQVSRQIHLNPRGVLRHNIFKIQAAVVKPKLDGIPAILKIKTTKVQEVSAPGPAIMQLQRIPG